MKHAFSCLMYYLKQREVISVFHVTSVFVGVAIVVAKFPSSLTDSMTETAECVAKGVMARKTSPNLMTSPLLFVIWFVPRVFL